MTNELASGEKRFRISMLALIVAAGLLAYANTFTGEFVWDDVSSILLHKDVQDPTHFTELFKKDLHCYGRGQGNFYRPLLAATFMLDYALSKPHSDAKPAARGVPEVSPFLFHVSSMAWHILAALLLFALLTRLEAPNFVRAAAPLLYVLHPLHTEAVAYISGRADSMAAVFMFAALWFAVWEDSPAKRVAGPILSMACYVSGLLSKESAFILPALLLVWIWAAPARTGQEPAPRFVKSRLAGLLASLVLLGAYAYLRATVLHFGSDTGSRDLTLGARLTEMFQAFALYLRLIFVPTGLHMERTLTGVSNGVAVAGALLLLACVAATVWSAYTKRTRAALGLAWFLITWFPISGVFPLNAPMAEHWLYVPLAGFLWAALERIGALCDRKGLRAAAAVALYAVCIAFLVLTVARNRDWRNNESLYVATLAENPNTTRIHYNLGVTYQDLLDNKPGARREFQKVIDLYQARKPASQRGSANEQFWDEELEAHLSLGELFMNDQRYQEAAEHFGVLLRLQASDKNKPMIGTAAFGMGQCLMAVGDTQRARQLFQKAAEDRPDLKEAVARFIGQAAQGA